MVSIGPCALGAKGWSCNVRYAVMIFVRLAIGTAASGPDCTVTPCCGTAIAASPVAGHGNALFFSALIPLVMLAVGYGAPRLRGVLAGVAVGCAAHLAFFAVVPMTTLHYVPHAFGFASIWLAVNAIACVLLARAALRR